MDRWKVVLGTIALPLAIWFATQWVTDHRSSEAEAADKREIAARELENSMTNLREVVQLQENARGVAYRLLNACGPHDRTPTAEDLLLGDCREAFDKAIHEMDIIVLQYGFGLEALPVSEGTRVLLASLQHAYWYNGEECREHTCALFACGIRERLKRLRDRQTYRKIEESDCESMEGLRVPFRQPLRTCLWRGAQCSAVRSYMQQGPLQELRVAIESLTCSLLWDIKQYALRALEMLLGDTDSLFALTRERMERQASLTSCASSCKLDEFGRLRWVWNAMHDDGFLKPWRSEPKKEVDGG